MTEIVLLIPLRSEADAALFSGIEGLEAEPSKEEVKKLSGVEIAVSLILSIGGSVAYDTGKAAARSLASRIRDYFGSDGEAAPETSVSLNGLQYDVSEPQDLEALLADLHAIAEAQDADAKQDD